MAALAKILIFLAFFIQDQVYSASFVDFIHAPSYLKFKPTEKVLHSKHFVDLGSTLLGLSPNENIDWDGLQSSSPFRRPELFFIVTGDGCFTETFDSSQYRYNTSGVAAMDVEPLLTKIESSAKKGAGSLLVTLEEGYCGDWCSSHLLKNVLSLEAEVMDQLADRKVSDAFHLDNKYDLQYLRTSGLLSTLTHLILEQRSKIRDSLPDVVLVSLEGLHDRAEHKLQHLSSLLRRVSRSLESVYGEDFVLAEVCGDASEVPRRAKRAASTTSSGGVGDGDKPDINLSASYDPNYPVIFNIVLWVSIILVLALLAITCGMWQMDPGRDSLIYRMTSTRLKKE